MDPLVSTLVVILLALLGARFSFSTLSVPSGPGMILRTGTHFLFVGFLLGPQALALITGEALEQLLPLMALGLGWVGFLFGLQLDRESLRHFPLKHHLFALGQALLTFVIFLALAWSAFTWMGTSGPRAPLILAAASTACISTPAGVALVSTNFLVKGPVRRFIFFVASVDAVVGIVALQVTYALFHPTTTVFGLGQIGSLTWVVVATGLGVIFAILFLWLTRPRAAPDELALFLLGIAAFSSGAALHLQLSPLFVSVVMGAVVANLSRDREMIFEALHRWEKPIYVILLLLAGALIELPNGWVVMLALGYALVRGVGKIVGNAALSRAVRLEFTPPKRLGLGLIPQGGISLAMAVSVVLVLEGLTEDAAGAQALFGIIVLGVLLSELVGPLLTTQLLRRAGEISPRVEEALAEGDERKAHEEAVRHSRPEGDEGAPFQGDQAPEQG